MHKTTTTTTTTTNTTRHSKQQTNTTNQIQIQRNNKRTTQNLSRKNPWKNSWNPEKNLTFCFWWDLFKANIFVNVGELEGDGLRPFVVVVVVTVGHIGDIGDSGRNEKPSWWSGIDLLTWGAERNGGCWFENNMEDEDKGLSEVGFEKGQGGEGEKGLSEMSELSNNFVLVFFLSVLLSILLQSPLSLSLSLPSLTHARNTPSHSLSFVFILKLSSPLTPFVSLAVRTFSQNTASKDGCLNKFHVNSEESHEHILPTTSSAPTTTITRPRLVRKQVQSNQTIQIHGSIVCNNGVHWLDCPWFDGPEKE